MHDLTDARRDRPKERDPSLDLRGWVHLAVLDELRAQGATVVRRFACDVVVWVGDGGDPQASMGPDTPAAAGSGGEPVAVPLAVLGGVVFMYRRAPGDDPDGPVPPLQDSTDVGDALRATDVHTTIYRMTWPGSAISVVENGIDLAHFATVHGRRVRSVGDAVFEVADDGTLRAAFTMTVGTVGSHTIRSRTSLVCPDPLSSRTRFTVAGHHRDLVAFAGPTGDHTVEVLYVSQSARAWGVLGRWMHRLHVKNEQQVIQDDIDILARRTTGRRPVLSDADGPILAVHRWGERFRAPAELALTSHTGCR